MKILLTNDDGINSPGINALADALGDCHEVSIIAPIGQRSASAHAITVHDCISYVKQDSSRFKYYYSVAGTPADCIKLAALSLMKLDMPELVISGINEGSNLGSDIMYSGTVSAALEAVYMGIKAFAVSQYNWNHEIEKGGFLRAAKFIADNLESLVSLPIKQKSILNINHPDVPASGVVVTELGEHYYTDHYAVLDSNVPNKVQLRGNPITPKDGDNDVSWARKNYITITPITTDRNDYAGLEKIKGLKLK